MKKLLALLFLSLFTLPTFAKKVPVVKIKTEYGEILVFLYDETPIHKQNFLKLTRKGFYDSTTFHRCIKNFVIQGGDPNSLDTISTNDGEGGPEFKGEPNTYKDPNSNTYMIPAEIIPGMKHKYGSFAAARESDNVNPEKRSSGSQFYIVVRKGGTPHLDGKYTVYGEVITGMDVAERIVVQPTAPGDRPIKDIRMGVNVVKMSPKKLKAKYGFTVPEGKK